MRTGAGGPIDGGPENSWSEDRLPEGAAVERLLREWEPVVRRMAYRLGSDAEREDLEQVGRIAIWQAASRFDPSRGHSFSSFAVPTVQGALLRHLRDRLGAVRIPRIWWELRPRLQRQADATAQELGREPTLAELADRLGVAVEDVAGALGVRDLCQPPSLDEVRMTPGDEDGEPLGATLGALDPQLEAVELRVMLREAIKRLPERLRQVVEARYFSGSSQKAVGRRLGISQTHVSRLEQWALARLRSELREAREIAPARAGRAAPPRFAGQEVEA